MAFSTAFWVELGVSKGSCSRNLEVFECRGETLLDLSPFGGAAAEAGDGEQRG